MDEVKAVVPVEWPVTACLLGDLLVVLGDARPMADLHSCDHMNCGSSGPHVLAKYREPRELSTAELMDDPRVAALVRAAEVAAATARSDWGYPVRRSLRLALAPFEEVTRG